MSGPTAPTRNLPRTFPKLMIFQNQDFSYKSSHRTIEQSVQNVKPPNLPKMSSDSLTIAAVSQNIHFSSHINDYLNTVKHFCQETISLQRKYHEIFLLHCIHLLPSTVPVRLAQREKGACQF